MTTEKFHIDSLFETRYLCGEKTELVVDRRTGKYWIDGPSLSAATDIAVTMLVFLRNQADQISELVMMIENELGITDDGGQLPQRLNRCLVRMAIKRGDE